MNATGVVVTGNDAQIERRQRLHELLLALIARQEDLELMDADGPSGLTSCGAGEGPEEAARWLDRNRRVLQHYQSLVRTAVTMDALLDAEQVLPSREI
ncbi:hypothetical protein [Synechococcus sp. UW179A]|uniref:hypothetical protein n=1 Tax=Synechococcus sp. UW179A TaxID=2575510 RepID=UPI000E0F1BC6|nr:hypothetical protein [Synechococcus sp. UW179A]